MNSFYSTLYGKFAELQIDQSYSVRFIHPINDPLPFMKTGKEISDCMVGIPSVKMSKNVISYGPFVLEDNEFGQTSAIRLAVASTCLLSAKSVFRWFYRDYVKEWIDSKSEVLRAKYVINSIMDLLGRKRIRQVYGDGFYGDVMNKADNLSAALLSLKSKEYSAIAQMVLASVLLNIPVNGAPSILKIAQNFYDELNSLAINHSKIFELARRRVSENVAVDRLESGWEEIAKMADALYATISVIPGKWHSVYLPYSNPLSGDKQFLSIYQSKLITEKEFRKMGQSIHVKGESATGGMSWQEVFYDLVREEKNREKMLHDVNTASKKLNFNVVGLPKNDVVGFQKLYAQISPQIRRVIERVRQVQNILDETQSEAGHGVDLQLAIQAIASESKNDMFIRQENLLKDESWTILIDASLSLSGTSREVMAIAICLAETAKEAIGAGTWAMFAFSDDLRCIKHYSEPYSNQIKARIGGLVQSGLSHIPDAIRAGANLARAQPTERNYVILVSDGVPSGYPGIEQELEVAIQEAGHHGVQLAGLGVGSSSIRKVIRLSRVVDEPTDIVKEFMAIYSELSS